VSKQISQIMRVRDAVYYMLTGDTFNGKRAAKLALDLFGAAIVIDGGSKQARQEAR
jgi:hypothetical protein